MQLILDTICSRIEPFLSQYALHLMHLPVGNGVGRVLGPGEGPCSHLHWTIAGWSLMLPTLSLLLQPRTCDAMACSMVFGNMHAEKICRWYQEQICPPMISLLRTLLQSALVAYVGA